MSDRAGNGGEGIIAPLPPDARMSMSFPYQSVHDLSIGMMGDFEEGQVEVNLAVVATLMTLGRLVASHTISPQEEMKFIQDGLDWAMIYFIPKGESAN